MSDKVEIKRVELWALDFFAAVGVITLIDKYIF